MTGENGRRVWINGEDQKKAWLTEEPLCVYQEKGAGWGRREREREREKESEERGKETKLNFQAAANQSL